MISNLIDAELAYINVSHPDFIGGRQAVTLAHQKQQAAIKQQQQLAQQVSIVSSCIF